MPVALFPVLREIDIHSNPLTTERSGKIFFLKRQFLNISSGFWVLKSPSYLCPNTGDPPLLTYYLQERLGITIKRKKTQDIVKLPLKVSTDPKWKVWFRSVWHRLCRFYRYCTSLNLLLTFLYCRWKVESHMCQRNHCWWMLLVLHRRRWKKVRRLLREHESLRETLAETTPSKNIQSTSLLLRCVQVQFLGFYYYSFW